MLAFMIGILGRAIAMILVASREEAPQPEGQPALPPTYAPHPSLDDLGADYAAPSPVGAKA